jgi:hypothetical protein
MIRMGQNGTPAAGNAYITRTPPLAAATEILYVEIGGTSLQRCGREARIDQYGSDLDSTIEGILEMSNGGIAKAIWNRDGQCKYLLVKVDHIHGVDRQYIIGMQDGLNVGDFDLVKPVDLSQIVQGLIKNIDRDFYEKGQMIGHHLELDPINFDDVEPDSKACICFGPISRKCPQHGDDK